MAGPTLSPLTLTPRTASMATESPATATTRFTNKRRSAGAAEPLPPLARISAARSRTMCCKAGGGLKRTKLPRGAVRPSRGLTFSTSSTSLGMTAGSIELDGTTDKVRVVESKRASKSPPKAAPTAKHAVSTL
eukprot:scaffold9205_cov121-Isochrysis_galbana.AAC.4